MPRPNRGPRLVPKEPRGYTEAFWFIRWYEKGKKREQSTGCPVSGPEEEASAALEDFLSARRRPEGPGYPHQFQIAEALDIYADECGSSMADPERLDNCILALVPFWGELMVSAVKSATCKRYAKKRGVSDGTIRRELGALAAALNHCQREGYLTSAPHVWRPEKPPAKDRWLTRKEAAALLRVARKSKQGPHLPLFILIGLYTGARKDAILSLR